MKKLIILAVIALVMSSCSKKTIVYNSTPIVETKNDTWGIFTLEKREIQKKSDLEVQFAIQGEVTFKNVKDTSFVNERGDIVDSVLYKEHRIKNMELCRFSQEKIGNGWIIYQMEFTMKNGDVVKVPFTATGISPTTEFVLKQDPARPGYIKLGDGQLWQIVGSGQKLMYSKKSGVGGEENKSTPNTVPGR